MCPGVGATAPPRRRVLRPVLAALTSATLFALGAPPASAEPATGYTPPLDRPVVDPFRPPVGPYGAGNRGIDYASEPGEPVRVAAKGEVTFAGRIGPGFHAVVLHPDGLRTSYSFLAGVAVARGERLERGDVVGSAGGLLHFGVRAGDRYLDPTLLFGAGPPPVHLAPTELRGQRPEGAARERSGLEHHLRSWTASVGDALTSTARAVGTAKAWGDDAVAWVAEVGSDGWSAGESLIERIAREGWEDVRADLLARWNQLQVLAAHSQQFTLMVPWLIEQRRRAEAFLDSQEGCTPADVEPPPRQGGRRIAVLVGGFGSSGSSASVREVATDALGYRSGDVMQFSYAGGRVPGVGPGGDGIAEHDYTAADTGTDLRQSGRRLRELLESVRSAHPGVAVDVIAHSQGGVVARTTLGNEFDRFDPRLPPVANLITLGSPHHGADLATAGAGIGPTRAGEVAMGGIVTATGGDLDLSSEAAQQLSERSRFTRELQDRPLPRGTQVTSIAASGDLTVAAVNSPVEGAVNALVPLHGPSAHVDLPGSAEATREMRLALAGMRPTCRDLFDDLALAGGISWAEDSAGAGATVGALWIDRKASPTPPIATPGPASPPFPG